MRLKRYYEKMNFGTQEEFARFLGVHPAQVSRWFKGERPISKDAALLITEKTGGKVTLREALTNPVN
jgi:DNA-binding transcriptional regulator YdaS (Cro superfamily)